MHMVNSFLHASGILSVFDVSMHYANELLLVFALYYVTVSVSECSKHATDFLSKSQRLKSKGMELLSNR